MRYYEIICANDLFKHKACSKQNKCLLALFHCLGLLDCHLLKLVADLEIIGDEDLSSNLATAYFIWFC
jgi:hypothetical protein